MSDQQTSSEDLMVKWYVEIAPPKEQESAEAEGAPSGEGTKKYKSNGKFTPYSCEPRTITVPSKNSRMVDLLPDDSTNQAPDVDLLFIKSDINYNECKFIDKLYFVVGSPGGTSPSTEKDKGQYQHPGHGQSQYTPNPPEPGAGYPPTQTPPTGYPPTQTPPTGYPPTQTPPTGYPPTQTPPTGYPPTQTPPTGYPPTQTPPTGYPPTQTPPTGYPPTQTPPAGYPPTQTPPAGYPPTQTPPAGYPPTQTPTGYPPPGEPEGGSGPGDCTTQNLYE